MSEIADIVKAKVVAWCAVNGKNREFVASSIGITTKTLRGRLNGRSDWRVGELRKLSELMDTPMSDLYR